MSFRFYSFYFILFIKTQLFLNILVICFYWIFIFSCNLKLYSMLHRYPWLFYIIKNCSSNIITKCHFQKHYFCLILTSWIMMVSILFWFLFPFFKNIYSLAVLSQSLCFQYFLKDFQNQRKTDFLLLCRRWKTNF